MLTLPDAIVPILAPFATLFSNPTWRKAQLLLVGAILAPGQRTIAAALRVMGRSDQRDYARYHEVLDRAVWTPREAARILLLLLLRCLDRGDGPLVFGIDETLERRRGARIKARGIYRDAVRSSRHQLVKASGLRWISLMWLGQADHHAAAPLAAPSPPGAGGRQQLRRAGPPPLLPVPPRTSHPRRQIAPGRRPLCASASPSARTKRPATAEGCAATLAEGTPGPAPSNLDRRRSILVRRRHPYRGTHLPDRGLYRSGKPPVPIRWVLVRDPQGAFDPQALLCTDPSADPGRILQWFVLRWQLEVTFREARTHLGMETQRQWSDLAIARTTPILLGLFSWTTLAAHVLQKRHPITQRTAAWYDKPSPTFVDAIALVRRHLWLASEGFSLSTAAPDVRELPTALYHRLVDALAYAA